jgi:hypothetical protein
MAGNMLPLLGLAAVGVVAVAASGKKKKGKSEADKPGATVVETQQVWESGKAGFGKMVTYQIVECADGKFIGQFIQGSHRGFEDKPSKWTKTTKRDTAEAAKEAVLELIKKIGFTDMPSQTAEADAMPVSMEGTINGYDYEIVEYQQNGQVLGYVGAIRKADGSEDWRQVAEADTAETARALTLEKIGMLAASGDNTDQA